MQTTATKPRFGLRDTKPKAQPKQPDIRGRKNVRRSARWKLSDILFYTSIALIGLIIFGFASIILKDPNGRQAESQQLAATHDKQAERRQSENDQNLARPPLRLNSSKCRNEYGFIKFVGEVTNRSAQPIENLMAIGVFRTSNGELVKSASSLIDYQPLMPGQRSPFTVITSDNPVIRECFVGFKTMFGGVVEFDD